MEDSLIFVSYAHPDQDQVIRFFDSLQSHGFNLWMDCKNLMPGQNWDFEVKRALDKSTFVVEALNHQLGKLGRERIAAQEEGGIKWTKRKISESWDGLPAYEVETAS